MKSRREKYEENNENLVRAVVKLRRKVATLQNQLIDQKHLNVDQHDEIVVLKIKLKEKDEYIQMFQNAALDLISNNSMKFKSFMQKTNLKFPAHKPKVIVPPIKIEPKSVFTYPDLPAPIHDFQINPFAKIKMESNAGNAVEHTNNVEKSGSHSKTLNTIPNLVEETSTSLSKLSLAPIVENVEKRKSLRFDADTEAISRSPVGKKQDYSDEVNESLRLLKERKTSISLPPVPDEANNNNNNNGDNTETNKKETINPIDSQAGGNIRKRRSEINPYLFVPIKATRSDTVLARSPTNVNNPSKDAPFNRIGKAENDLSKVRMPRSNHRTTSRLSVVDIVKHPMQKSRSRSVTPTRIKNEMSTRSDRPRRSQTPIDYTRFFKNV